MELNDLKNIWQKEKDELQAKIILDEKLIKELTFEKSKNSFDKLISKAIIGRNMALVYMVISLHMALKARSEFGYSLPALIGALAMLISFFQHFSLKKPNYSYMSTIELQKTICEFRIHTSKYSNYDMFVVCLWFATIIPIILKYDFNVPVTFNILYLIILSCVCFAFIFDRKVYKKWYNELKESEEELNRIIEFEK